MAVQVQTNTRYRRAPAAPLAGLILDSGLPGITVSGGESQSTRHHLDGVFRPGTREPDGYFVSDQRSIRSHSLAQSDATGQVNEPKQFATAQRFDADLIRTAGPLGLNRFVPFEDPARWVR